MYLVLVAGIGVAVVMVVCVGFVRRFGFVGLGRGGALTL